MTAISKKRLPGFSGINRGVTPSVATPGVTHPVMPLSLPYMRVPIIWFKHISLLLGGGTACVIECRLNACRLASVWCRRSVDKSVNRYVSAGSIKSLARFNLISYYWQLFPVSHHRVSHIRWHCQKRRMLFLWPLPVIHQPARWQEASTNGECRSWHQSSYYYMMMMMMMMIQHSVNDDTILTQ